MPESINSKLKEQYDHDDSGGSLDTNLGDFLDSEGASGTSNNSKWRDWASGTGTSLNTRLFHKHGGSGSFMTRWKNWIAFSSTHSINFDGSNDYLSLADSISLSGQFTISMWVYLDDNTSVNLLGDSSSSANYMWIDGSNDIGIVSSDLSISFTDSNMTTGSWQHILVTRDGSNIPKFYKNGALVQTLSADAGTFTFDQIGAYHTGSNFFDGLIDEVAVWDTALSASDVTSIYNNGKVIDLSKSASYGTDRTGNLKLWLRCGDKAEPESTTAIARQDFYTDFDGSNDRIEIKNTGLSLSDLSVIGWFYYPSRSVDYQGIISMVNTGNDYTEGLVIQVLSNAYLNSEGASVDGHMPSESANQFGVGLQFSSWNHFAYTVDRDGGSGGVKLYINGELAVTDTAIDSATTANNIYIGSRYFNGSPQRPYIGYISNIGIYQTTLDAQTISQMAKSRFTPMRDNRFSVVDFDGTNDIINCGSDSSLDNIWNGGGTLTAWIFPESDGDGSDGRIAEKRDTGSGFTFTTREESSGSCKLRLFRNYSTTNGVYTSGADVTIGAWNHVAVTYDTSGAGSSYRPTIYINGVESSLSATTDSAGTADSDASEDFTIGGNKGVTRCFDGSISSVAVYNTAKSAEEVYALYSKGITYNESSESGLVGLWRMGDDTSKAYPTIADSSSNSNDGTITNGASDDIVQQMVAGYDLGAFESSSEALNGNSFENESFETWDDADTINWWTHKDVNNNSGSGLISQVGSGETTGGSGTGSVNFFASTSSNMSLTTPQNILKNNTLYKFVADVSRFEAGQLRLSLATNATVNLTSTDVVNNQIVYYFVSSGSNYHYLRLQGAGVCDFTLDSVSLKEVLQSEVSDTHPAIIDVNEPVLGVNEISGTNWGTVSGITVSNGSLIFNTSTQFTNIQDSPSVTANKIYKVVFTISSYTSGSVRVRLGGTFGTERSGDGTYTEYIIPAGTYTAFYAYTNGSNDFTVEDISVKEVHGNVGTMTNQASDDLVYSSVLPDQSFLTGVNSAYNYLDFDGTDAYVASGTSNIPSGDTSRSISVWLNADVLSGDQAIVYTGTRSTNQSFAIAFLSANANKISVWGTSNDFTGTTTISTGTWYHVVAVYDSSASNLKTYINGTLDIDTTVSTNFNTTIGNNIIGSGKFSGGAYTNFFNGKIAQPAIWNNRTLSSTEVSSIYTAGRHSNLLDSYSDNLVSYHAFGALDSKTGLADTDSTIYDRSGNSNHGTTSGTATGDLKSPPNAEPNGYAKGDTNRSTTTP